MSIKQCTGKWSPIEDRIFFRFNTPEKDEYSFWLTRHVVNQMIHGSAETIKKLLEIEHDPRVAKRIQEFQQSASARKTNFKSQYEQASKHPLGPDPILVIGCSISLNEKNKLIALQFRLSSKQRIGMKLTVPMVQRIVSLLEKLQLRAGWGLVDSPQDSLGNSGVSGDLKNFLH